MKLLLVDDNPLNHKLLRAQLAGESIEAVQALNGVEALALLNHEAVDGIISDILMPEMDGFRLCLELRNDARFRDLPLVLYTSTYDSPADRALADSAGADAYLTKPAPVQEILRALAGARSRAPGARAPAAPAGDAQVLRQYNEALVRKLEERNLELLDANAMLQAELRERLRAEEALRLLNESLERRVADRTQELAQINNDLEATNRGLEAFSYTVSHDLRSPLFAIDGLSELMLDDSAAPLAPEVRHNLELMRSSVKRMAQLIEALLRLARTARQPLERRIVDLEAIAYECVAEFGEEIARRHIGMNIERLPTCPADAVLLRQVFINLVGNAVKYTQRQPQPLITVGHTAVDGKTAIYVKDNGAGFDMRYADKLFGVFQRLHPSDAFEGTGVGLAIVQRIVQRHGGSIWAQAEPGRGATFYFTLGGAP